MGEETSRPTDQSDNKKEANQSDKASCNEHNRYSRNRVDSSISSWLESKEEKRAKAISKGAGGRDGLKKSRLNPVSKKQKKKNDGYKEAMASHYSREENQKCFLCGTENNLSIHHKKKRGNLIDDELYFVTLCVIGNYMDSIHPELNSSEGLGCHNFIERNKGWAREMKLIL